MAKNQTSNPGATMQVVFTGEVDAAQIAAWKTQFKIDSVLKIKVKKSNTEYGICYLKPADRNVTSLAYTHIGQKQFVKAGEVFVNNCWIGGDEEIKTVDRLFLSACLAAYETLDIAESEAEKL
jgi:hypothetical protein